jgi:hypothetical protein
VFKPCMTTPRKPFYFTMKFTATWSEQSGQTAQLNETNRLQKST